MAARTLSNSEVSAALECWAKWDFMYGGRLTGGDTLKPKGVVALLTRGGAWGAGMAAWHSGESNDAVEFHFRTSLLKDAAKSANVGLPIPAEVIDAQHLELVHLFQHYADTQTRFANLTWLEEEITVPIWSRREDTLYDDLFRPGRSNRFHFLAKIDGFSTNPTAVLAGEWIVEFKLRGQLRKISVMERETQLRWYAWAYWMKYGRIPAGIIVDSWLAEVPQQPRLINATKGRGIDGKMLSEAKDQVTRLDWYLAACEKYDQSPAPNLVDALTARRWGLRAAIPFSENELWQAGQELVSAGKFISMLDRGELQPLRNAGPRVCGSCRFDRICSNPRDKFYVDTLFTRGVPKRLLPPKKKEVTA